MLAWTIYISFAGALVLALLPKGNAALARWFALAIAAAGFAIAIAGFAAGAGQGRMVLVDVPWVPSMGIHYVLAADGISRVLVLLTGLAAVAGVLFSWNINLRTNEFFAFFLALIGGVYGVFLSFDLFLLFVFYEIAIVPKYFLIAIWGSTRREYAAMKLALYSFVGSAMVLIGVVMKLGAYGCLRVAMGLFPHGMDPWGFTLLGIGSWRDVFAILAVIGIVYGALVALVQTDFKFVIGYSSVSHMGFVLLGLMTLNQIGLTGAVLQMYSHGVLAGLLFAIVGRIVYDRTHTRQLAELERIHLARRLPFAALAFVIAGMASMGLPGFSGFVAELQVLAGSWIARPWWTATAGVGIVVGVAYTWRALQKAFFTDVRVAPSDHPHTGWHDLDPITWPEYAAFALLALTSLWVGLYPRILLDA